MKIREIVIALAALLLGIGVTVQFRGEKVVNVPGPVRVDSIHVITPATTLPGKIKERIVYRERKPTTIVTAPAGEPVNGNYRTIIVQQDTVVDTLYVAEKAVEQLRYSGDEVSVVYRQQDSLTQLSYDVPREAPFDFYFSEGQPKLRTPRCVACSPTISLEGGVRVGEKANVPYAAIEASLAVLSRDVRVFIRPEITDEFSVRAGFRYRF